MKLKHIDLLEAKYHFHQALSVHKNRFFTRYQVDNIKYVDIIITAWMLIFEFANCGTFLDA